MVWYKRAAV